jgi:hypothetical protein
MTWQAAASIAEIVGAMAVVISLIYLSVQVRGGNALQAAQARYNLRMQRSVVAAAVQEGMEALLKYSTGENVTPAEKGTARLVALRALEGWEWQYAEYKAGMLDFSELPVASWRVWYRGEAEVPIPFREIWGGRKQVLRPDFVQFMEENVVNER